MDNGNRPNHHPHHTPVVKCDVRNCVYNRKGETCTADGISIGTDHAFSSADTNCGTFKPNKTNIK